MLKKIISLVLGFSLIALLFTGTAMAQEEVKFGLVAPFTGTGSILGEYIQEGLMLAVDEINDKGGIDGKQIKVITYDTEASPATAINVVKRIIEEDEVDVLFGPNMSSATLGVHGVAQENEVIQLVGATSPSLRYTNLGNPWLFRLRADDQVKVNIQVDYAVEVLGLENPGVIYGGTDYCTSALAVMEKRFEEHGLEIVGAEQIMEGEKDATGQLLRLKNAGIDHLMGLTHEPEGAVVVRQLDNVGLDDIPVIGFSAWGVPAFTDLAEEDAIGTIAVQGFTPEDPNPVAQEFTNKYQEKYGRLPSDPAQAYYDGANVMKHIIEEVGLDSHAMRDALENLEGFPGLQGELTTDEHHNLSRFAIISEFKGDHWEVIEKFE